MTKLHRVLATVLLSQSIVAPVYAGLMGSSVTTTLYYPNLSTIYSGPDGPHTVGASLEFPVGSLARSGSIDVNDAQIIWTASFGIQYGAGAFNGFKLVFSGAPPITGVSVDPSSTITPTGFSSTATEVYLDLASASAPAAGNQVILNISTTGSSVPDAGVGFLGTVGLFALLAKFNRRQSQSAT